MQHEPAKRPEQGAAVPPPINMYETTNDELVIVCAMPGVEPQDVEVEIAEQGLTVRSPLRGPGQENRQYLEREFVYGAYSRAIPLPCCVDGRRANVIFRNGLLTVVLPRSQQQQRAFIRLQRHAVNFGQRLGHQEGNPQSRLHNHNQAALAAVPGLPVK